MVVDVLLRIEEVCLLENYLSLAAAQENDANIERLLQQKNLRLQRLNLPGMEVSVLCETLTETPRPNLLVPIRQPPYMKLHDLSQPAIRTTRRLVKRRFFFSNMNKYIGKWTRCFIACQTVNVDQHMNAFLGFI